MMEDSFGWRMVFVWRMKDRGWMMDGKWDGGSLMLNGWGMGDGGWMVDAKRWWLEDGFWMEDRGWMQNGW